MTRNAVDTPGTGRALSEAVREAINSNRRYEEQRRTVLGRGTEALTGPLGGAIARLLGPEVLRGAMAAADAMAGSTLGKSLAAHDTDDVAACEAAALRVQGWAQGSNAATGAAAGWFGAAGLAADIPATLGLAARTVRATAICYGFAEDSAEERAFRLMVLEVASATAGEARSASLGQLNALARHLDDPLGRAVTERAVDWVSEKVVDRIARQLGVSLAGRKAGQVIPVIGGAVGAVINASFQADVARAARYAYSQRWLMARRMLPAPEEQA
jgi:hypothetical protein